MEGESFSRRNGPCNRTASRREAPGRAVVSEPGGCWCGGCLTDPGWPQGGVLPHLEEPGGSNFFICGTAALVFPTLFFPPDLPLFVGQIAAFSTFAVASSRGHEPNL